MKTNFKMDFNCEFGGLTFKVETEKTECNQWGETWFNEDTFLLEIKNGVVISKMRFCDELEEALETVKIIFASDDKNIIAAVRDVRKSFLPTTRKLSDANISGLVNHFSGR